jgi:hypothetical protein
MHAADSTLCWSSFRTILEPRAVPREAATLARTVFRRIKRSQERSEECHQNEVEAAGWKASLALPMLNAKI